ncbi:efflux RND transporter permease subunit [Legionella londiniensis]|uniref:Integral membrane protein, AcrB/AcrD/AcrF family n=1 Tax=Legionella londiniensis TaxID=45068 RepID=A0A0W0VM07_9GAMM|nr:efflux RND transporter permease subunit [Legionella londiniensis]KTD21137.1 integral membrane protein, AcrB/AcrD/AcrF family [Legionella londiniensis]STX93159.1 integral membrane protein, AcrB/AcrD/AcrF family [Legionella londiniensis]
MKVTTYFIEHPVIAIVLNIMLGVLGILCLYNLSVREYPQITFPIINISAVYPNASSELVESSVTNILEDRLAGIEGLDTITSQSNNGSSSITLKFQAGTSMDKAFNAVQDAVSKAQSRLPDEVKPPSIERKSKTSGLPFIGVSLESTTRNFGDLTHYANLNLKNIFRSLPGVASVNVWGQPYTYKIELEPEKLFSFGINASDVMSALIENRISLPAGNYQNKIPATLSSRLNTQKDYEDLLIPSSTAHPVTLKSIADISLTTDKNQFKVRVNGNPGLVLSINRAADANPLEVSKRVHKAIEVIQQTLPADLKLRVIIDQSDFIDASIHNVRSAIIEAIALVLIIVFLFLRNFRATIIPLVTIPISLLGALFFLKLFGYSLNLMTLLAMVLAIGLVVDDAIIVLENIWRHIEEGLSPLQAAKKGAREIGFAVIAMTFTLISVYLPLAFIEGMLGQLFIEFAVALAGSVFISGIVALTLSPLMCGYLLRLQSDSLWPAIDQFLSYLNQKLEKALKYVFHKQRLIFILAIISIILSLVIYQSLNQEMAPKEDRGLIGIYTPATKGENISDLDKKIKTLEKSIGTIPESKNRLTFIGDWGGNMLFPLKPHSQRNRSASQLVEELKPSLNNLPSIEPRIWSWDTGLPGIDSAGNGTQLDLVISTTDSYQNLFAQTAKLKSVLDNSKAFSSTYHDLHLDSLGYEIKLDHKQLAKLNLNAKQVAKTIEIFFSGDKSQSFEKDGIEYSLIVKGKRSPYTLHELYVTAPNGKRISLGAVASMKLQTQPVTLEHYQQMRSTTIHVQLKKEDSLEHGIKQLWQMAKNELPRHYGLHWVGAAKAFHDSSNTMLFLFFFSLVFIYAILATQFENFIDPFIILFTVPLACSGALLFAYLFNQSANIYTQVGLITLIGLISKHGILIVEFANQLQKRGVSRQEAILEATVLRLRPILMTTAAMIFGAIPLLYAHDAGAEARRAIGTVLVGGLGLGTLFTLFVLPVIYNLFKRVQERIRHNGLLIPVW